MNGMLATSTSIKGALHVAELNKNMLGGIFTSFHSVVNIDE